MKVPPAWKPPPRWRSSFDLGGDNGDEYVTYAVRIIYNKFVSDPVGVGLLVPETEASDQQARSAGNMRGMTVPRRRPPQGPLKCSGSRRLHAMMIVTDPQGGSPLHFWHDAATRSVTGPSAARIRATAARWSGVGVIHGMQPVAAPDPLGSDRDMAVMLASLGYVLPESLRRLLPKPGPNPTGAVVNPGAHNPAPIGLGTASRFPPRNPVLGWAHRRRRWRGDKPRAADPQAPEQRRTCPGRVPGLFLGPIPRIWDPGGVWSGCCATAWRFPWPSLLTAASAMISLCSTP